MICACGRGEKRKNQSTCRECHREWQRRYRAKTDGARQRLVDWGVDLMLRHLGHLDDYEERRLRQQTMLWLKAAGVDQWDEVEGMSTGKQERDILKRFVQMLKDEARATGQTIITLEELERMFPEQ